MRQISLLIKSHDEAGFSGHGSVFLTLDRHRDAILPGAFKSCLGDFLENGFIGGVGHDHGRPIGKPVEAFEDSRGLFLKAKFSDVTAAREARTLIMDGVVKSLSVGFEIGQARDVPPAELQKQWAEYGYQPNAEDKKRLKRAGSVRLIESVSKLFEVSPVTIPANDSCAILSVKGADHATRTYLDRLTAKHAGYLAAGVGQDDFSRADKLVELVEETLDRLKSARNAAYIQSPAHARQIQLQGQAMATLLKIRLGASNA